MSKHITSFNRSNLKALRSELDDALNKVLAKHGLSAELGNIRFGNTDFRTQLTVNVGNGEDAATNEFKKYAIRFGLTGNEFGKTFTDSKGTKFTIVGIKPKSHKYPILAKNARGTTYKFPASYAKTVK